MIFPIIKMRAVLSALMIFLLREDIERRKRVSNRRNRNNVVSAIAVRIDINPVGVYNKLLNELVNRILLGVDSYFIFVKLETTLNPLTKSNNVIVRIANYIYIARIDVKRLAVADDIAVCRVVALDVTHESSLLWVLTDSRSTTLLYVYVLKMSILIYHLLQGSRRARGSDKRQASRQLYNQTPAP